MQNYNKKAKLAKNCQIFAAYSLIFCLSLHAKTIFRMKRIYLLIILGLLFVAAEAQVPKRVHPHLYSQIVTDIINLYADSLSVFRARQNSLTRGDLRGDSLRLRIPAPGIDYNLLYMPATFYRRVPKHAFSLDARLSLLDQALLDLYVHRPDLVGRTETQLAQAGDIIEPTTVHVKHAPEIVERVAPKAKEVLPMPVDMVVMKPNFWTFSGDYNLQFLQNYVSSNWYQGGESNYSMVTSVTLNANYNNKQKVRWDNKLEMQLGFQTSRQDTLHSLKVSQNLLRFTTKLGLQATKRWYYTIQAVSNTQFMRQWNSNSDVVTTDFLGPLNVNVSIGMDYNADWFKSRLKGSFHLAPLAYNFRYVNRASLATRYGIEAGKRQLHNYGSTLTADLVWTFSPNISWKTRLYGYTTYERAEITWENTFSFRFNKWISTTLYVYPRFDDSRARDDHYGYFQLKEYSALGFSYAF